MASKSPNSTLSRFMPAVFEMLTTDRRTSELRGFVLSVAAILVGLLVTQALGEEDLGIGEGLVVSGFVTLIYELHSRAQKDRETMAGILKLVYNDVVADGFWEEIETEIFDRRLIRKNAKIQIDFYEEKSLPGKLRLHLKFSYELAGLRPSPREVRVVHRLNFHVEDEMLELPRFEHVTIGDDIAMDRAALARYRKDKRPFEHAVTLRPKNKERVPVKVFREELSYLPGTYNFVFTELTSDIEIESDHMPEGVVVTVSLGPGQEPRTLSRSYPSIKGRKLFLPGSCIEFRLERTPAGTGVLS